MHRIELLGGALLVLEMWAGLRSKGSKKGRARVGGLVVILNGDKASQAASERNIFNVVGPNS